MSEEIANNVDSVSIKPYVLTDHKGILIKVHANESGSRKTSPGYLKLNKNLLENEWLIKEIRQIGHNTDTVGN